MGVWIETFVLNAARLVLRVTPCMGVWIETYLMRQGHGQQFVTPCMGVWIETSDVLPVPALLWSHPVWVCGLKQPTPCTAFR